MSSVIFDKVSKELGIDSNIVKKIVNHQFEFADVCMQNNREFRLPYLGAFVISEKRKKIYDDTKNLDKEGKLKYFKDVQLQRGSKKF